MPTSSSPSEALGHRIHLLRRKRKLSQAELAARIGATPAQISKYESGGYEPRPEMLGRLAGALETTTDFLILGYDSATTPNAQLKSRLSKLESLPEELRSGAIELLDGLFRVHGLLELRKKQKPGKQSKGGQE